MTFPSIRSRAGIAAVAAVTIATTGAGAATIHRYAVTQGTGSLGATSFTQNTPTSSALQGEVAASPNTSIRLPFGVLGEYDAAGTTFGIGVAGISTTGYAVGGEALGSNAGVIAINAGTGNGLEAYSSASSATSAAIVTENTGNGPAISATGDNNDGVDAYNSTDGDAGVYGADQSPDYGFGVEGYSTSPDGAAVVGLSPSGAGIVAASAGGSGVPALAATSLSVGTDVFDGIVTGSDGNEYEPVSLLTPSQNNSGTVINGVGGSSDLQINGDVILTGSVYTGCKTFPEPTNSPKTDCSSGSIAVASRASNGSMVRSYTATHASATIEDEGEAQLVNGYAHVALDPTYASAISMRTPYLVFTTPQGDGPGLFVTRRTATGFDVRQSQGGRSSMTFDYRIVAHPFGADGTRMATVDTRATGRLKPLSAKAAARLHLLHALVSKHRAIVHHTPHMLVSLTHR